MGNNLCTSKRLIFSVVTIVLFYVLLESVAHLVEYKFPPRTSKNYEISQKSKDTYEIFIYGGSTVWGSPIKEFGFVSQLEYWLREIHPDKRLKVYNFGLPGKSSSYVRRLIKDTITETPDLLIVLSGHNEFLYRNSNSIFNKIINSFAVTRILMRVREKIQPPSRKNMPDSREIYDRQSNLYKNKVKKYLENLNDIVHIARKNNTPIILMTAPHNFAAWPPVYKKIHWNNYINKYEFWVAEIDNLLENNLADKAQTIIRALLQKYNTEDPLLLYLLAKANETAGNYERAYTLFIKAKDLDPLPWRALSQFNQHLRKLANNDGIHLVDLENIFQQRAKHGLVGFSFFADNVHPTPLGNAIISRELIKVMSREHMFLEQDLISISINDQFEHYISHTMSADDFQSLKHNYFIKNAKYSMKTPFYNFKESRIYLDKALAMDASDWRVWLNLSTLAFFENRIEEGQQKLRKAIQLKGSMIDPNDRGNAPYIGEALKHAGIQMENFQ